MTLLIATSNPEGIILTADSRQTYTNRANMPRIASDHATKILEVSSSTLIAASGPAFFWDSGRQRSVNSYVEEFSATILKQKAGPKTTSAIAAALDQFCQTWLTRIGTEGIKQYVAGQAGASGLSIGALVGTKLPYDYVDAAGKQQHFEWQLPIPTFIVAGRDPDGTCHGMTLTPFSGIGIQIEPAAPQLMWVGQTEVLNKLFTGPDPFVISVATMTVQDAIDLSILLTRTTENLQKFSDGTATSQGGIPGVGGSIDVVYIPLKGKIQWLHRKELHASSADEDEE